MAAGAHTPFFLLLIGIPEEAAKAASGPSLNKAEEPLAPGGGRDGPPSTKLRVPPVFWGVGKAPSAEEGA